MNEVMTIENIEGVWEEDSTIDFAIETLERYLSDASSMNRPSPLLSVDI